MSKRKAQAGIKGMFAKARDAPAGLKLPDLEVASSSITLVPDVYVSEVNKQFDQYRDDVQGNKRKQLLRYSEQRQARSSRTGTDPTAAAAAETSLASPASSIDLDDADGTTAAATLEAIASRVQTRAVFCTRNLAIFAGTSIALQLPLQEQLLYIVLNHDLHPDPHVSVKAYKMLQQNLAAHPPVRAVELVEGKPRVLEVNNQCWDPMSQQVGTKAMSELLGAARFELLQQLVKNAVLCVTGDTNSSSTTARSSASSAQPSQGKALMLLYLVQLLQSDCMARLAVFEQHMHSSSGLSGGEQQQVRGRAGNVLKGSLLHRLMENDPGWTQNADEDKGRHRLVRDLLALVASSGDQPAQVAQPMPAAAAGSSSGTPSSPEAAAAEKAAAEARFVPPVAPQELINAARVLLLLLLQLYSNCEAAGVYGGETHGSHGHHAQRGNSAAHNDRYWLDHVMLRALGALGGGHTLQALRPDVTGAEAAARALQRVLQLLPAVHRVRLVALTVAEAISSRSYEETGVEENNHINALHDYFQCHGKGHAEFRKGDALEVMKALSDRLEWASKEVLGGREAFALMVSSLVSAALPGRQLPQQERQEFVQAAQRVVEYALEQHRARLAKVCGAKGGGGFSDVALSLGLALQQLKV